MWRLLFAGDGVLLACDVRLHHPTIKDLSLDLTQWQPIVEERALVRGMGWGGVVWCVWMGWLGAMCSPSLMQQQPILVDRVVVGQTGMKLVPPAPSSPLALLLAAAACLAPHLRCLSIASNCPPPPRCHSNPLTCPPLRLLHACRSAGWSRCPVSRSWHVLGSFPWPPSTSWKT